MIDLRLVDTARTVFAIVIREPWHSRKMRNRVTRLASQAAYRKRHRARLLERDHKRELTVKRMLTRVRAHAKERGVK